MSEDIKANLTAIRARIAKACKDWDRNPADLELIAVSKTYPAERIEEAIQAGHYHFGENRVQEAQAKFPLLKREHPNLRLHLIGPLQTNKVREAIAIADYIHALDREKLARALAEEMRRQERQPSLFIQINIGEEVQKAGIAPKEAANFIRFCRELQLPVIGLMCIPPAEEEPSPYFALLAKMARDHGLKHLSMGMSADFEKAIALGATHVRIGSAIFGARPKAGA